MRIFYVESYRDQYLTSSQERRERSSIWIFTWVLVCGASAFGNYTQTGLGCVLLCLKALPAWGRPSWAACWCLLTSVQFLGKVDWASSLLGSRSNQVGMAMCSHAHPWTQACFLLSFGYFLKCLVRFPTPLPPLPPVILAAHGVSQSFRALSGLGLAIHHVLSCQFSAGSSSPLSPSAWSLAFSLPAWFLSSS